MIDFVWMCGPKRRLNLGRKEDGTFLVDDAYNLEGNCINKYIILVEAVMAGYLFIRIHFHPRSNSIIPGIAEEGVALGVRTAR